MTDDIEGDVQQPADSAPPSEPASEPGEIVSSDEIRQAVETQRERGPDGKFIKGTGQRGADKGIATGAATDKPAARGVGRGGEPGAGASESAKADSAAGPRPPPGFSVATKQAWDSLPEHVKADIAKHETEIETGLKRYTGLARFAEEAERNGTTLQNAISDYAAVETEVRRDPVSGVEFLFQKMGVNPLVVLNQWVKRYMAAQGQTPGQQQPPFMPPPQQQIDPNAIIAQATNAVRSEFQMREINNDIVAFAANPVNRFFANVRMDMSHLVQVGKASNLQEAYEAACWLNPEIRAILIEEMKGGQDKAAVRTAARAQNAAKAVTGAPSNSHAGEPARRRDLSIEEEIRESIKAQRGAA